MSTAAPKIGAAVSKALKAAGLTRSSSDGFRLSFGFNVFQRGTHTEVMWQGGHQRPDRAADVERCIAKATEVLSARYDVQRSAVRDRIEVRARTAGEQTR